MMESAAHSGEADTTSFHMDRKRHYQSVFQQVQALMQGVDNRVGVLANISALLHEELLHYFWVGFYIVRGEQMELGPFQGSVACYAIQRGHGVCGTAWAQGKTLIVPDVHQFDGHIACSSLSNSEIVVPVMRTREVIAVIDVDSKELDAFDQEDRHLLEQIAALVEPLL